MGVRRLLTSALSGLAFVATAWSQACETNTLQSTVPGDGTEIALGNYSYCGGTFNASAYVANVNFNKVVTLFYTNRQNESTPLSSLTFGYSSSIENGDWELWTTRCVAIRPYES